MDAFLYNSLDAGVMLLCASQRLAHRTRVNYAHHAQSQGRTAWPTPKILTFNTYLADAFSYQRQHQAISTRLLNELQTQIIWESIVVNSKQVLLSSAQAARSALHSWQLLHQYQIPLDKFTAGDSEEAQVFLQWSNAFIQYTQRHDQLDIARLPEWIRGSSHVPDTPLQLIGFDYLLPAYSSLMIHWRQQGCVIHIHDMPQINTSTQVVALKNVEEELHVAARWSRHQREQGKQRIGVVVPALSINAAQVKRNFTSILAPATVSNLYEEATSFSIAASTTLSSYPLVHHAMLCLRLLQEKNDFACYEQILRSPFIAGYEQEINQRALMDIAMRQSHQEQWVLSDVQRLAMQACPLLSQLLQSLLDAKNVIRGKSLPSQWTIYFNKALAAMGWAQGRTLSSTEQQTRNKFHEIMAKLTALDEVVGRVSDADALQLLRNACQQASFAPESNDETITIIDADTAAGMQFDALWVMGLHADAWPAVSDPDPFVPLHLQRQYGIKASRADTTLQMAKEKLQRLVNSASEVILSWPQHDKDVELRSSTLLQWPAASLEVIPYSNITTLVQGLIQARPSLEAFSDANLPTHPGGSVKRGARIFELQSRCAFRAQAELRLHATSLEPLVFGISSLDRGTLIHRVLQELWNSLHDSHGLNAALQSEQHLRNRIAEIASRHIQQVIAATTLHQQRMAHVETMVAVNSIMQLLYHESSREPFSVHSSEQRELFEIEGLKLRIQPDRIDQLANDTLLLIDYKTGDTNRPQDWLDINEPGRPRSPQLPLYAVAHSKHLSGIAYAILAPGIAELRGLADRDGIANGIRNYSERNASYRVADVDNWSQLLQHWSEVMNALARQFRQGVANVDPLPNECQYCTLTGLCRVKEQRMAQLNVQEEAGYDD